jgi:hypothetical protein
MCGQWLTNFFEEKKVKEEGKVIFKRRYLTEWTICFCMNTVEWLNVSGDHTAPTLFLYTNFHCIVSCWLVVESEIRK